VLRAGAAAGVLASFETLATPARVLEKVLAAPTACGPLTDIEHVVIFMNENRSFDSYFGTYRGVKGFHSKALPLNDGSGKNIFAQPFPGPAGEPYGGHLLPFRFDTTNGGDCVNDIAHDWKAMHECWNNGALDGWVDAHLKANPQDGHNVMGYYTRQDLPFFHALADNFTICDRYFCSVIGQTDPNRLYSMSATVDLDATSGPSLETQVANRGQYFGTFTWRTYPEQLQDAGISWKIYSTPDGDAGDGVLHYFKAYEENAQLAANAFAPRFPNDFLADCAAGTLPQVSWVLASLVDSEHPPAPVTYGEVALSEALNALVSNQALWEKTALFYTYDENGGFFDHVPPPTPPEGTPGEYLHNLPDASIGGPKGPIGLGFRVPMLVISPYARGGLACGHTFDHTSTLRFLESRFGPPVPNLSKWRRRHTGDLTQAFNFGAPADPSVPTLPTPSRADTRVILSDCPTQAPDVGSEGFPTVKRYPLPTPPQAMPSQERGKRRRPSGC
jgi:phospholipase C